MAEDGYTIKEILRQTDERQTRRLDEILDQVKKTNGRVLELEKWRAYLTGAVALAIALGLPNIIELASNV